MNNRGSATVEAAIVIPLFLAMVLGFFELFLMAWMKLASVEAAYRFARSRAVYMDGTQAKVETFLYWPLSLSAFLLSKPEVSGSSQPPWPGSGLLEVTVTTKVDSLRFSVLRDWAHANTKVETRQIQILSPGGSDLMKRSYPEGELDP